MSTDRLDRIYEVGANRGVHVQAGVSLSSLDAVLRDATLFYPPARLRQRLFRRHDRDERGGCGNIAAYARTTREWVERLTVVLASGDVLEIERGATHADADGCFEIQLPRGVIRVDVPAINMPDVPKLSAGYFAATGINLIDLFVGSEGTFGVIAEATLRVIGRPVQSLSLRDLRRRAFGTGVRAAAARRGARRAAIA